MSSKRGGAGNFAEDADRAREAGRKEEAQAVGISKIVLIAQSRPVARADKSAAGANR